MSLLPSRGPETSTTQEGDLQVVGVDEAVAPIFDALSSDTARDVLNTIYDDPGTPSEIADRLDMSIQKVSYHLEKLAEVDLIEVAGTRYSEKGQEMTVYQPPDDPLVLFVGTEDRKRTLRSLVKRVVPTLGILAVASAAVQSAFSGGLDFPIGGQSGGEGAQAGDSGGDPGYSVDRVESGGEDGGSDATGATEMEEPSTVTEAPSSTATEASDGAGTMASGDPQSTATEIAQEVARTPETVTDGAAAIEPGLAFFLGGIFALSIVALAWYVRAP